MKRDIINEKEEKIAEILYEAMEKNEAPWQKTWAMGERPFPYNAVTDQEYSGQNLLTLFTVGAGKDGDPRWCGFHQAQKNGWNVKKGSKATPILIVKPRVETIEEENGEETIAYRRPFITYKNVFHASDIEGIPSITKEATKVLNEDEIHKKAEDVIKKSNINIMHTPYISPCYFPEKDRVTLPPPESFKSRSEYYQVVFHEIAHATGSKERLNRQEGLHNQKGDNNYTKEELRAEISSCLISLDIGSGFNPENSTSYLKGWGSKLPKDELKKEILSAVKDATKIKDWVLCPEKRKELEGRKKEGMER